MLPVQVNPWYQSGASGIAISVVSLALATGALASLVLRLTGSLTGALTGAALITLNPNVLYLQSTPMTEPLLFGLTFLGIAATARWLDDFPARTPSAAGAALAASCLTRYEAWAISGAVIALAGALLLRRGHPTRAALRASASLALWPTIAIVVFTVNSRWVVGEWFVTGGFFVPENVAAIGNPAEAWRQIDLGLRQLSGRALVWAGYAGAAAVIMVAIRSTARSSLALLLALAFAGCLPMAAYLQGHPFRIRYDLPLVAAAAALAAAGISVVHRRIQPIVALLLLVLVLREATPLDRDAPLVQESQREAAAMAGRRAVTDYLRDHYDGTTIMMSMGSLGHYMHDLASIGFDIKDFLHEGNGKPWEFAMLGPAGRTGWIVIEQQAEGGDALAHAAQRDRWLNGFEKVAEGGGVALFRALR